METTSTETPQELKVVEQQYQISSFANKDSFEHVQRVAIVFSKSELVPKKYQGNPANCVIALEMAGRMNVSPLMVMQNLDIILGRPCWSSKFLIASLNACGRFSPLRYEDSPEKGGSTRAWAIDKATNEKLYGVWISMEMAKAEGWIEKSGSKWKTMPELMRRYRAASFFTNQYAPEISMGFQTAEEVIDISQTETEPVKANKELERVTLMIADCKTTEELDNLCEQTPADLFTQLSDTFNARRAALKQ